MVFLGFTGASSVGLLIGQRHLLANDQQLARQSIALCDKAIRGLQDDPAQLEQELLFHSNANTSLWIEDNSGTLLRPRIHRSLSDAAIHRDLEDVRQVVSAWKADGSMTTNGQLAYLPDTANCTTALSQQLF